jgi:uncharacterized protein (TIGR02452 family)
MPHLTYALRAQIAAETIALTPSIISTHSHQGASLSSTFSPSLPPLSPALSPSHPPSLTRVLVMDTFTCARLMISQGASAAQTAVLNLASDIRPGGGWASTLSETQEEALCYSSTLYATLKPEWYPWANLSASGIFSPGVVVHRGDLATGCKLLPEDERVVGLGVVTVAAPRYRRLTEDRKDFAEETVKEALREKVRAVLRMAAVNGRSNLVLGAMGCGAYGCPPQAVAREMRTVLEEKEWMGWFERVWWAVVDPLGEGNAGVFGEVCSGIQIRGMEISGNDVCI